MGCKNEKEAVRLTPICVVIKASYCDGVTSYGFVERRDAEKFLKADLSAEVDKLEKAGYEVLVRDNSISCADDDQVYIGYWLDDTELQEATG